MSNAPRSVIVAAALCTAQALGAAADRAAAFAGGFRPGAYRIDAHYGMPHLEQNLRHARTTERRCLHGVGDLATVFPVLRDTSMQGCALERAERIDAGTLHYTLVCRSSQAPTGSAVVHAEPGRIHGVLHVKGGAKNMTYSQRVEAARHGDCTSG